jgi:two-component system, LytTR family, response regulator
MKILIIDNETDVRETLHRLIEEINPSLHEVQEATGVITGLKMIHSFQPDVVFLDVEMDDGTGFDLLKQIGVPSFQLIFTTAFNQYAVQAFKFSAIEYLMKPVNPMELANALLKATQRVHEKSLQRQLDILLNQVSGKATSDKQIVLKDLVATYFVKISDILYCKAEGAYTQFFLRNTDPILVSRNLHTHEEMLAPLGFLRSHHSTLVNPDHIRMYDRKTDCLVLEGGHSVPVAQRKKEEIIKMLESR